MGVWKKTPLEKYDNELGKIEQEEIRLKKRLLELKKIKVETLNNRRDAGIKKYLNLEKRKRILKDAEELGFSLEIIEKLKKYSDNWNQDIISNEIIDEFENMEKYILAQAGYKSKILYKLAEVSNMNGGSEVVN